MWAIGTRAVVFLVKLRRTSDSAYDIARFEEGRPVVGTWRGDGSGGAAQRSCSKHREMH